MSNSSNRLNSLTAEQRQLLELRLRKELERSSTLPSSSPVPGRVTWDKKQSRDMQFSLFFFSSDGSRADNQKYRLLFECAKFADSHGFSAVWTPERHFQGFGGLYPNPSVLSAALAMATERIGIRAGSVTLPLHNPIRVAEEWSVVDNLSNGRVGISFASGWHAGDFILSPELFTDRKAAMFRYVQTIQKLWAGEPLSFPGVNGAEVELEIFPKPLQASIPIWITSAGNPETWMKAGEVGAHVLTGMQSETFESLEKKIDCYRQSLADNGYDPNQGQVTVMLYAFVGHDLETVRETVRPVLTNYLRTFIKENSKTSSNGKSPSVTLSESDNDVRAQRAFEYCFDKSSLLGTIEKCSGMVDNLQRIGVNEIACLVDFGLDTDVVLQGLTTLNELRQHTAEKISLAKAQRRKENPLETR